MVAQGPIGWFGKLPAQGDFLRGGMGDPLVQRFAGWLEEASEACHRGGGRPTQPVRFAWRPAGEPRLLVGALRDSVDKVGRVFPLALFAAASGTGLAAGFPGLPAAWGAFLGAAEALLAEAGSLDAATFAARAGGLALPGAAEAAAAGAGLRQADGEPAAPLLARLFGEPAAGGHLYAAYTFRFACSKVKGREPTRAEVVLDCPVSGPADLPLWLDLARRTLAWPAPPPFLWREGAAPRLALSLGVPPGAALLALCEPPRDHPKIWPLRTTKATAVEAARKALGAAAAALDRPGTVGELLAAMSR